MTAIWRIATLFAVGVAAVQGLMQTNTTHDVARRLASAPGNIAVCYTPFHNHEYPLRGGGVDINRLRNAIEDDFRIMSKHVTHVRTFYTQHFGIEIAPIAKKYGLKLYLGVFMTKESWGNDEVNAAARAIKQYSDTVEVVLVGNENMINFETHSWDIINKVNEIKSRAGGDAWRVKYGTVQRVNEYLDPRFDGEMRDISNKLDILGVNIYPFFSNSYDENRPTDLLEAQWNAVTGKWGREKVRLTETGFPTAGNPSSISPRVRPSLHGSFKYYEGVVNWWPQGAESYPKFWFQMFDRREGDPAAYVDLELHFGFYTVNKQMKRDQYPRWIGAGAGSAPAPAQGSSASACAIQDTTDYAGNDIANAQSSRAEGCFAICNSNPNCGAFTWTSYNGGTCWLKSSKGAVSYSTGARSAVRNGLEYGVDYSGGDIGNAASGNAEGCVSICQGRGGCKAFTWTNYNGGTCWLKSGKGNPNTNGAATSGVIC